MLGEREGIAISRPSLQRILRAAGLASPRGRRPPRHRSRRERMPAEGLLLQLDGSRHAWLEERGPRLTLVGAIDDATGQGGARRTIPARPAGRRLSRPSQRLRAERSGTPAVPGGPAELSQVGGALMELGIGSIIARLPRAKGRIERLWGTFQDRLVVELRLARGSDRAGANELLASFLPRFNARFAVPPADPVPAWRPLPAGLRLDRVFVFKYRCKVARDHTIRLDGRILQLPPGRVGAAMPGAWSRSTCGSTARSSPSTGRASSPSAARHPIPSSCAPNTASGPTPGSCPERLPCPGCHRLIIHGAGSGKGTKLYQQRLTESLNT